jgi:hypothetical protein
VAGARLFGTGLSDLDVSVFYDEADLEHSGPSHIDYLDYRTVVKSYHNPRFRQFMTDCGVPAPPYAEHFH